MKLTDLKRTKKEMKGSQPIAVDSGEVEKYPYGLRLNLRKEELSKLGIKIDSVKMGQRVKVEAETEIVGISESQYPNDSSENISFQIQKIALDLGKTKMGSYSDQQSKGPGE